MRDLIRGIIAAAGLMLVPYASRGEMALPSPSVESQDVPTDSAAFSSSQSVGLVLSGGGAKGIAHIGVIKALEDNNIPIDFVAGTSMGAIVGGLYACGYTPEEMMALLLSDVTREGINL